MTGTLKLEDGGTGIIPINNYVLVPTSNCAPINNDSIFIDFLGGFFILMFCLIVFYYTIALVLKLTGLDN